MSMRIILFIIICILFVIGFYYLSLNKNISKAPVNPTPLVTIQPSATVDNSINNWKTYTDQNVTFKYPDKLGTTYIFTQLWPPTITVSSGSFSCKENNQEVGKPTVIQKVIGNTTYCIESLSQGAAGTTYTQLAYSFMKNAKLMKFEFTLGYPQCDNYPDPKKSSCKAENQSFNVDTLINRIAGTIQFIASSSQKIQPTIASPSANTKIKSPLTITGTVPTGWMYEGVFPIKLLDENKNLISQTQGKEVVPGSWTSGKTVEFSAAINFSKSSKSGFIRLEKDNPSGLAQNADSFEIPIQFK